MSTNHNGSGKRPIVVWVICIYILLTSTLGQFNYISTILNYSKLPEKTHPYFQQITSFDLFISILISIFSLISAFYLFKLEKKAIMCWIATLATGILAAFYHSFIKNWGSVTLLPFQKYGSFAALIIPLCIFLYSLWLSKKKIIA
jgi:hypothetical protein